MNFDRRDFLTSAAVSSLAIGTGALGAGQADGLQHDHSAHEHPRPARPAVPRLPALICKNAATIGIDAAYKMLTEGQDTLEAALHITQTQENDANDSSAGLGGLPTEDGIVELDACCMHGPSRRSAAVGAVSFVKNASLLARAVMKETGYSLIVGDRAERFALAQNFAKEDLLTDRSRKTWSVWKQIQALQKPIADGIFDANWPNAAGSSHFLPHSQEELDLLVRRFEPLARQAGLDGQRTWRAAFSALFPAATALYVSAINQNHEMSCAATTSGLPWRTAGVAGDVAVIGAGCYLDNEVGSAGASGNAEANIKISGTRLIVEAMRRGSPPQDAGMEALQRIVERYRGDMTQLRFVDMVYYVLRKDGAYSCVSLWHGDRTGHTQQFTIHDGARRTEECAFLLEGSPANGIQPKAAVG